MTGPSDGQRDIFAIAAEPLPLPAWTPADGSAPLQRLQQDMGELLGQLGAARHELSQRTAAHEAELRKLLLGLLEIADAFERVFLAAEAKRDRLDVQARKWLGNFRAVHGLLTAQLQDCGVVRLECLDDGFDPARHRAAGVVSDPSRPEGTIVEEVRRGYVWRGLVLRKPEVTVVRHREPGAGDAAARTDPAGGAP